MSASTVNSNPEPATELELRFHHASSIRASPTLAESIRAFVNEGYSYMTAERKLRWEYIYGARLPSPETLFETVGEDGMFAVLYHRIHQDDDEARREERWSEKPIACAATKRWKGDLENCRGDKGAEEEGWEILTVTTLPEYMRKGHAGTCIDALVEKLQTQAREGGCEKVTIWTQAVEELNGRFWKNRGWVEEVRSYEQPVGHWGSRYGYRLLVLKRDFVLGEMQSGRD
ncbi:hypothetical protein DE146DRAFT_455200 [Phaeosphaeria sp. MPI-PUGE-AT-0046c]|nr:hypothetical protein DE146DRAFT_455200 [Phaeosphaeria sp. MPI-PUGE-AT-0046c]